MKWVTRSHAKVDRIACPWLIRRFIDPAAEFLYVPAEQVLETAAREDARSYDAPGARYTHRNGKCSFEVLVEEYALADPALARMARIVHGADVTNELWDSPEAPGLKAIAHGFSLTTPDDHAKLAVEFAMYDALYAWCEAKERDAAGAAN
jgi:hypothetical protein